jgi:phage regulator Rha-like protein
LYNSANGINALKNHVYIDHFMIAKIFEEEINNLLKKIERELAKKILHVN